MPLTNDRPFGTSVANGVNNNLNLQPSSPIPWYTTFYSNIEWPPVDPEAPSPPPPSPSRYWPHGPLLPDWHQAPSPPLSPERPRLSPIRDLTPDNVIQAQLPSPSKLFSLTRKPFFNVQNVSEARKILTQSGSGDGMGSSSHTRTPLSATELVELARIVSSLGPFLEPHGKKGAAWQNVWNELVKLPSFKHKEISAQTVQLRAEALLAYKKVRIYICSASTLSTLL